MCERPIIFSAPMVRVILDGRKTQTRRVVKLTDSGRVKESGSPRNWHLDDPDAIKACPYGVPGDRLWVRETWAAPHSADQFRPAHIPNGTRIHYAATEDLGGLLWRPSIHMPRWASRITLEIVSVRVERLQDISEKDAFAEGIDGEALHRAKGYAPDAFRKLWDSINAKRAPWGSNPWVWVIEFRRIDA